MSGQITPGQIQNLLTVRAVVLRLVGLAAWRTWFADAVDNGLTPEERDLRQLQRRVRR